MISPEPSSNISRRGFLAAGATAAVAAAATAFAPGRLLAALEKDRAPMPDLSTWANVRAQFQLSPNQLHFSNFFIASHPKPVRDAIDSYRRVIDSEPFLAVDTRMFQSETDNLQLRIRDDLAPYLGANRDEIALTGNTTTGLALFYAGLRLSRGDEILTTDQDHYSHHESIRFATERAGAAMRKVVLYADPGNATREEVTRNLRAAIRPNTRVVGLTWVHSSTGVCLPIRALADVVDEANRGRTDENRILLMVDGAHGLGAVDESVGSLGCDFFSAGTHKWMLGPRGTGILWGQTDRWARLRPTIPTFASLEAFNAWMRGDTNPRPVTAYDVTPGGFHAYEHQWAMSAAFKLHEAIGRPRASGRIRDLNTRLKDGLAAMQQVKLRTPRDPAMSAGLVCFEVAGTSNADVVRRLLGKRIVASTAPYAKDYVRLSPSLVNNEAEVDAALRAVAEIAGA